jgi:hypothetical protein
LTQRTDWFRVIVDLERAGYSLDRIAAECLRGKTWAWSLKNVPDTEPRFHDGMLLLGLWAQATGKNRAEPPVLHELSRG